MLYILRDWKSQISSDVIELIVLWPPVVMTRNCSYMSNMCREQPSDWGRLKLPAFVSVVCLIATLLIAAQGFQAKPAHNGSGWFSRSSQIAQVDNAAKPTGSLLFLNHFVILKIEPDLCGGFLAFTGSQFLNAVDMCKQGPDMFALVCQDWNGYFWREM